MLPVRNFTFLILLFFALAFSGSSDAVAKTWFVERDGTGDYIIIQDAVNAAASGDTIKIGLGRFDERHYVTSPGWSDFVRVKVTQQELTIIGSGPGSIIGQDYPYDPVQGSHLGIVTGGLWGNQILRVENLHLENMDTGIYTSHEGKVWNLIEIKNCSVDGIINSLQLIGGGGSVLVEKCEFSNLTTDGFFIVGWDQAELKVRECTFTRTNQINVAQAINLTGVQTVRIESCNFIQGSTGVTLSHCETSLIKNCMFDGQMNAAMSVPINTRVSIENCQFRDQAIVLVPMTQDVHVEMINSVVEDVEDCSFKIAALGSLSVHNCDLAKGERGVVYVSNSTNCTAPFYLDMTHNYWGTVEPDSIQAWIFDKNDDDDLCYFIEYEPFETGSTPVESKSFGGLRAMFR